MRDILDDLHYWLKEGKSIALATVIQTWGSAPRGTGSKMAITSDGRVFGSVSGGCVENAVMEVGVKALKTNQPQLVTFGVSDETAWEVGLACGGRIEIFVKPVDKLFFEELRSAIMEEKPVATATVIRGPAPIVGDEIIMRENVPLERILTNGWDDKIQVLALETLSDGVSRRIVMDDEIEVFIEAILPPPTLIVVGGVHIAMTLTSLAKTLGYRTIVIDPRKGWGNNDRFPDVDRLIQVWPKEAFGKIEVTRSTAIVMLTHDPKLDDPALTIALASAAFYVGALGSKSTNAKRRQRLLDRGVAESQLSRLHAPIGLDIGAQSPEEIGLAIMAEVVDAYRKREQSPAAVDANLHSRSNYP